MSESPISVQIEEDKKILKIHWNGNHTSRFNCKWIRFHCHCERCWRPFSGMYPVDKTEFGNDFVFKDAAVNDGNLKANFENEVFENHETVISVEWLLKHCNCQLCLEAEFQKREIAFSNPATTKPSFYEYKDIQSKEGMFRCIDSLLKVGFCFLENVPIEDKHVMKWFDILVKDNPYNTQNTAIGQVLHQDLPYYEVEPGIQYLHAYQFDECVTGGESVIVDLFLVANKLKENFPDLFDALTRIPACFETKDFKRDVPAYYETRKPHIELDLNGKIVAVHWNPGVEGVLRVNEDDVGIYYQAYNEFLRIIRTKENQFVHRLRTGQVLMFNNHRVLHSRNGFKNNGGIRHLQGCYTNLDDMKSKYMVLANQLNIEAVPIKVGNKSSF